MTPDDVAAMKVAELKTTLSSMDLPTTGTKSELAKRLLAAIANAGDGGAVEATEQPQGPPAEAVMPTTTEGTAAAPEAPAPSSATADPSACSSYGATATAEAAAEQEPCATVPTGALAGNEQATVAAPGASSPAQGEDATNQTASDAPAPPTTAATDGTHSQDGAAAEADAPAAPPSRLDALRTEVAGLRKQYHELHTLCGQWYHSVAALQQQQAVAAAAAHAAAAAAAAAAASRAPAYRAPAAAWTEHYTAEGHRYWYNATTGQSSWEPPHGVGAPHAHAGGGAGGGGGTKAKGPPGANLFVMRKMRRGEYDDFNDEDLRQAFERFGPIIRAEITLDKETGVSKGFGFVSFATLEAADAAIAAMNGAMIAGKRLSVERTSEDGR